VVIATVSSEDFVAFVVAESLIGRLEVVEPQHEHRDFVLFVSGADQRVFGTIREERAIRQTREQIVKCLVRKLQLKPFARLEIVCDAGERCGFFLDLAAQGGGDTLGAILFSADG
jgi:hypothetical protein